MNIDNLAEIRYLEAKALSPDTTPDQASVLVSAMIAKTRFLMPAREAKPAPWCDGMEDLYFKYGPSKFKQNRYL